MKQNLEDKKKVREMLRQKAQVNEYMFALLRENGIAARLDENIGIDFINMNRTSRALEVSLHDLPRDSTALIDYQGAIERTTEVDEEESESEHEQV